MNNLPAIDHSKPRLSRLQIALRIAKAAVNAGYWPLFRYNPALVAQGKNPFQLDSRAPSIALKDYIYSETRYTMLVKSNPEEAQRLLELAKEDVASHWKLYDYLAHEPANGVEVKK